MRTKLSSSKSQKGPSLQCKLPPFITIVSVTETFFSRAFSDGRTLTISTLLGNLTHYHLIYDGKEGSVVLQQLWQKEILGLEKVNALIVDEKRIIVGGFSADGRGVIGIWKRNEPIPQAVS